MRFTGNGITNCYPDQVEDFISITVLTVADPWYRIPQSHLRSPPRPPQPSPVLLQLERGVAQQWTPPSPARVSTHQSACTFRSDARTRMIASPASRTTFVAANRGGDAVYEQAGCRWSAACHSCGRRTLSTERPFAGCASRQ